jgi:hypothetical protein
LIHTHQNDLYNVVTFENLFHLRIRPSLEMTIGKIDEITEQGSKHPKLREFARGYRIALNNAAKYFQKAVEHTTAVQNEKINKVKEQIGNQKTVRMSRW